MFFTGKRIWLFLFWKFHLNSSFPKIISESSLDAIWSFKLKVRLRSNRIGHLGRVDGTLISPRIPFDHGVAAENPAPFGRLTIGPIPKFRVWIKRGSLSDAVACYSNPFGEFDASFLIRINCELSEQVNLWMPFAELLRITWTLWAFQRLEKVSFKTFFELLLFVYIFELLFVVVRGNGFLGSANFATPKKF